MGRPHAQAERSSQLIGCPAGGRKTKQRETQSRVGSGDPQTSKGCTLGRVFRRQKEEEGHFWDRDVTQNTRTRGAKEGGGQGLRSQPTRLDPTGSEVGTSWGPTQGRPPQQRNSSELEGTLLGGWGQLAQNESPQEAPWPWEGGVSHAGSQGLRDQRNQPGWGCFQVFKVFRPSSVHRTHCTARRGSKSKSGRHIHSPVSQLFPGHSLLFPGREDLSILLLPYPLPPSCQIHRLLPVMGVSA